MDETLIGYARCSTDEQDLTAQRQALLALGVSPDRSYIDHGMSGTKRERPGLDQALAAVRAGDTLGVPKLDRLALRCPMLETSPTPAMTDRVVRFAPQFFERLDELLPPERSPEGEPSAADFCSTNFRAFETSSQPTRGQHLADG